MWVKICGNTNLEDASRAAELGADAVGFVFAPSKRKVTAAQVAAITPHLPSGVERVGVFYSRNAEEIAQITAEAGLTTVQLHGGLDVRLLERLAEKFAGSVSIIQTLHWTIDEQPLHESADIAPHKADSVSQISREIEQLAALEIVDRVLIDSKVGAAGGGTGVAYDWGVARAVFASAPGSIRIIVAGGLNPTNVAQSIEELTPWGVDVSSGVEASPGRRDPALVARFIANARGAETP
jgi:phosphoribosylanthranilate isomerase